MPARSLPAARLPGMVGLRACGRSLAVAAALATCLTVLRAQQPPPSKPAPSSPQLPQFKAEASLVRVDAYVTAGGRPVEDLPAGDFEVLEDNVPQKVETFEYVRRGEVLAGRAPGEPERRGRLFVLFVDTYHLPWVDRDLLEHRQRSVPTWQMPPLRLPVTPPPIPGDAMFRDALEEVVRRVVGDDDRVAVLTPDMWGASLTFMERQAAIDELATRNLDPYVTGQRPPDPTHFEACFPQGPNIEPEMRVRYRMWRTFAALEELVANLELVREERKALLLVTRGWDPLPRILGYQDPRTGFEDDTVCHTERVALAERDFEAWYHTIIDNARRSNVAFYSIYAHPLVTYKEANADIDEDTRKFQRQWGDAQGILSPETPRASRMDRRVRPDDQMLVDGFPAIMHDRTLWYDNLKDLSKDTNGRAILTKDDFDAGLTEIADSLSSYYLLGYYSTNTKRDGKFRKITVNVKRKGVTVRARPGYRAVIPAEAIAAEIASRPDTTVPPVITSALAALARMRTDVPFYLAATPEWDQAAAGWKLRVIGEVDAARARDVEWRGGWRAEVTLATAGKTGPAVEVNAEAGRSAFSAILPSAGVAAAGDYEIRAKAHGSDKETVFDARASVTVPASAIGTAQPWLGRPLLSRRQNAPRTQFQPTADQRFSRREILLVELPVSSAVEAPTLRLVDRQGQALGSTIPVTVADRNGTRVAAGMLPLANVAPGDYVIEIAASEKAADGKVYVAFRVVP